MALDFCSLVVVILKLICVIYCYGHSMWVVWSVSVCHLWPILALWHLVWVFVIVWAWCIRRMMCDHLLFVFHLGCSTRVRVVQLEGTIFTGLMVKLSFDYMFWNHFVASAQGLCLWLLLMCVGIDNEEKNSLHIVPSRTSSSIECLYRINRVLAILTRIAILIF